jgi:hypothetical protein
MTFRTWFENVILILGIIVGFLLAMIGMVFTPTEAFFLPGSYVMGYLVVGIWQWFHRKKYCSRIDPPYCLQII